ncbi:MAG: penicillin-binding protein 1C [Flavobacteriales bacterium]
MRIPHSRIKFRRWSLIVLAVLSLLLAWTRWWPMSPLFADPYCTVLLDKDAHLLGATVADDGQWRFPPGEKVPMRFATCLLQFEDRHFRSHWGIRPQSLVRAWEQNRAAGRVVSGGSTITMQVARMARGNRARTYMEKFIEAFLALRIEIRMDKDKILDLFAAHAPFGGNVVGLDAAAWRYFGRPAERLSWSESATLAVLPNAPSAIYPGKGHDALRNKRDRLLTRLLAVHAIDSTEWSLAKEEPLPEGPRALPQRAPHLLATLKSQGHDGEILHSTLDGELQDRATAAADLYAGRLLANEVHNAAAIILETATGRVLAYVGNLSGAGAAHAGEVDIVRSRRSTGSVLKPFLYAEMLQGGELLPDMLVADIPTRYNGFAPRNYDEHYNGAVPASEALSRSLNVPAVRALHAHGIDRTLRLLRAMGLKSIDRSADDYGLSLIVGGAESTPWELAGAYADLGRILRNFGRAGMAYRQGDVHPPVVLAAEADQRSAGAPVAEKTPILSASSIYFTLKALREVARPEAEQGWKQFAGSRSISWKTGTSFGHRDAWAIGLTAKYCIAVWTGNASGEGRPGLTGTLAAAPLLFDLFNLLPASDAGFEPPYDEMVHSAVCRTTGFRANRDCPQVDTAWVPPQGSRTPLCPYHRRVWLDASGTQQLAGGAGKSISWFQLPPAMEHYYMERQPAYKPLPPPLPGTPIGQDRPMDIMYPDAGGTILIPIQLDGSVGSMVAEVAHRDPRATLYWDLDGTFMGTTSGEHRMALSPEAGLHRLTLTDQRGNREQRTFTVVRGASSPSARHAP